MNQSGLEKEGKNKSGGLNEKGRKSYERRTLGSDLKTKKVGNPRSLIYKNEGYEKETN